MSTCSREELGAKVRSTPRATLPRLPIPYLGLGRHSPAIATDILPCERLLTPSTSPSPSPPPFIIQGTTSSVASLNIVRQKTAVINVTIFVHVGCLIYQCHPRIGVLTISIFILLKIYFVPCLFERFAFLSLQYRTNHVYNYRYGTYSPLPGLAIVTIPTSRRTVDVHLRSFVPYTTSDRVGFSAGYT